MTEGHSMFYERLHYFTYVKMIGGVGVVVCRAASRSHQSLVAHSLSSYLFFMRLKNSLRKCPL